MIFEIIPLDVPLENGIIFTTKMMTKVVEKYHKEYIDTNNSFGELIFNDNEILNDKEVDQDKISHKIIDLYIENQKLIAKIDILKEYTNGRAVDDYRKNGQMFNLEMKGYGDVDEECVVYDYELVSLYLTPTKD